MDNPQIPTVLALLLCDQVITDAQTNKKSLIGVFHNAMAFGFPLSLNIAIYAKLVDAQGKYDLKIRVVHLKDEKVLGNFEFKGAQVLNQLQPWELAINIAGFVIPEAGKYEFQLYANDVYLSRITMEASSVQLPGGAKWPPQPFPPQQ